MLQIFFDVFNGMTLASFEPVDCGGRINPGYAAENVV